MARNRKSGAPAEALISQKEVDELAASVEALAERIETTGKRIAERFHHELSSEGISVCELQGKMRSLKGSVEKTDAFFGALYDFAIGR